jgi:murein DD-endopeptidase MepM/ murein hydrolase activator NlpD
MPRHKPQRPIPYNEKDRMQPHAPTWIPEEHQRTWLEWLQSLIESPEPKLPVEVTPRSDVGWDEELRQRAAAGARNRHRQEQFDNYRAQSGKPISPDEQLKRDIAADLRRRGKEPLYFSPKAAHPDDPYKDRTAWPAQPQFQDGETDVTVVSPWGLRFNDTNFHPGLDFRNRPGRPAFSPKNGTILAISQSPRGGNEVFILLDDGSIVSFAHTRALDDGQGRKLDVGDEVYAGQLIGWSDGSGVDGSGKPVTAHTHISYYPPGTPVDPDTKKPLQGPRPHDPSTMARTQRDPFDGLGYRREPRRLNAEGYTGKQPMIVDRGGGR